MREALAAPYGRALLAELGQSISTSADPACLQAKSLTPPQLNERAGALIETWGIRALEQIAAAFDAKAHEARLTERVGPNAVAELKRLREQPDVKRYRAIERNWRLARIADFIFEQFDRYALVARLNLRPVSPLATGNEALLRQNPAESLEDALDAFREKNKSAALERYLALAEASAEAVKAAIKPEAALTLLPGLFRGVESDLAALCIGKK